MKQQKILLAALTATVLLCLLLFPGSRCQGQQAATEDATCYQHDEDTIFGTLYHAKYRSSNNLKQEIEEELRRVDASLSMFNPQSTVSHINRNETTAADSMLVEVLRLSQHIHQATHGAFDPTVAPLVNAWGFGFKSEQLPDSAMVDSLRSLVGLASVHLHGDTITKDKPLAILDFSAIAKGYGTDRAAQVLRSHGIQDFMVEIGGEIVAKGLNEKGEPWRIGINKPADDSTSTSTELQDVVAITEGAIATSGNYRNYYVVNGRKIAHTINPLTGYPAQQDILSSTVIAPSCAEADAFATAFMVLGLEKAKRILKAQPQLQAYFICSDEQGNYTTWCTESLRKLLVK